MQKRSGVRGLLKAAILQIASVYAFAHDDSSANRMPYKKTSIEESMR